jgi:hypothetical protein
LEERSKDPQWLDVGSDLSRVREHAALFFTWLQMSKLKYMNFPTLLLFICTTFVLFNCSGTTNSSADNVQQDSIAPISADTISSEESPKAKVDYITVSEQEFLRRVETSIDSIMEIKKARSVYSLSGSFSGYESGADATYYFDSVFSLTYCEISWSSEGSSGTGVYFFDADEVDGGKTSESEGDSEDITVFYSIFQPHYGVTTTLAGNEPTYSVLDGKSFNAERSSVNNDYNRLINRIVESRDGIILSETDATLDIEKETDGYGESFTEREAFRMSIEVYENVIKPEL